ncbi:hypothetical protein BDQ94DRAFT_151230 [Aspergillus welwitschiae]|uniref:Uncharacterized protein n=1 Tax=Aspergillus welwitschiae TaxID=1341132 RepID=A0A3F3PQ16_9EURO|nr:hypothetical protein BDQ94DRAFT_151230 [Aspergillus welwitschiae]RDH29040.1 hypothetical protein BDQ94DRAFT_151230 [Aspergillus welwitschiae]
MNFVASALACFYFLFPPGELEGDAIIAGVLYDIGQRLHSLHGWLGKYVRQSTMKRSRSTVLSVYIRNNHHDERSAQYVGFTIGGYPSF